MGCHLGFLSARFWIGSGHCDREDIIGGNQRLLYQTHYVTGFEGILSGLRFKKVLVASTGLSFGILYQQDNHFGSAWVILARYLSVRCIGRIMLHYFYVCWNLSVFIPFS